MSDLNPTPEPGAEARGQKVVRPGPRDLFLDLDTEDAYQTMNKRLADLRGKEMKLEVVSCLPSRSGLPHRHVILRANCDLSPAERIALQACLGSDLVREFLSFLRYIQGGEGTTFYENHDWEDPRSST